MHLKVYRRSQKWHPKGRYYSMHLDTPEGELLVERSSDPAHAAARALVARGHTGPFEIYVPSALKPDKWVVSLRFKSAKAAALLSVVERDRGGPMVIPYRPGPAERARTGAAEALLAASAAA